MSFTYSCSDLNSLPAHQPSCICNAEKEQHTINDEKDDKEKALKVNSEIVNIFEILIS